MNEDKFTGRSAVYAKFRPAYPVRLFNYLYSEAGFSSASVIADIGAGTGIFSRMLLERGSTVICVEPNADMLATAKDNLAKYSRCSFVRASAENTTLAEGSADFITVAQAFHWFDRSIFRAECKRILSGQGRVALVWNSRDRADALSAENAGINKRYCPGFKGFSGGSQEDPKSYADFFRDGQCVYRVFKNDLSYDRQSFVGRNLSASYAPSPDAPQYAGYIRALESLFDRHSADGRLVMSNNTRCYVGEV